MAQLLSYQVRNWDQYYGVEVQCGCNDCATKKTEKRQIVVELSIPNCCESCNRNLADAVTFMEGFERLQFEGKKLTVIGTLKVEDVLKVCKKVKKSVKLWPQPQEETQTTLSKSHSGTTQLHQYHHSEPCSIL